MHPHKSKQKGRIHQREDPTYGLISTSSVYMDVNTKRGPSWYDFSQLTIPTHDKSEDTYSEKELIGEGHYSSVYKAYDRQHRLVTIKKLNNYKLEKILREIHILQCIEDGPNCLKLYKVFKSNTSGRIYLILEYCPNSDFDSLMHSFSDLDIRRYLFLLMKTLVFAHSNGIMHRDIKPDNIMFDPSTFQLRLIDWGLADFYFPNKKFPIHVSTKPFKAPELLTDYQYYDYSVDIWSFGVIMAAFLFKRYPFFSGYTDYDILASIARVFGSQAIFDYLEKFGNTIPDELMKMISGHHGKSLESFVRFKDRNKVPADALDLLSRCLVVDHTQRITADDALQHPYFDPVREIL